MRELARTHFLERAGQPRRRNMIERRYRTTARGYILSPELLGRLGLSLPQTEDAFSAAHLLGFLAQAQSELGRTSREAAEQNKRLTTLSVTSELRFESAEQRSKFADHLRTAVIETMGRYASPYALDDGSPGSGRPYRLILGC